MVWATSDDVVELLGASATAAKLARANADVTVYANRSPAASAGMRERDLYWLRMATCYQAVWLDEQVSVDARQSVDSMSQDGMSVNYAGGEWKVVLAPMAGRTLRNLSWKATRTERPGIDVLAVAMGFLRESFDDDHEWEPLEWGG